MSEQTLTKSITLRELIVSIFRILSPEANYYSLAIVYGIGISFLYWIALNFCLSLGYGGMLPPVIAAWIANFIFLGIGLAILMTVEY